MWTVKVEHVENGRGAQHWCLAQVASGLLVFCTNSSHISLHILSSLRALYGFFFACYLIRPESVWALGDVNDYSIIYIRQHYDLYSLHGLASPVDGRRGSPTCIFFLFQTAKWLNLMWVIIADEKTVQ